MTEKEFETLTFGQRVYSNCSDDNYAEYQVLDINKSANSVLIRTGVEKETFRNYSTLDLDLSPKRSLTDWLLDLQNKEKRV